MRHFTGSLVALGLGLSACSDDGETTGTKHSQPGDAGDSGAAGTGNDASSDAGSETDSTVADANDDSADSGVAWHLPACTSVTGTGAVTFTSDEGATLAPTGQPLSGTVYTKGLITLDVPNVVLAASGGWLLRSEDAGCTFSQLAALPSSVMVLVKSVGERAYGYEDNGKPLVRIEGSTVTTLKAPADVIGLGTDPTDPDRVRLGGSDGSLWDSTDGGATWDPLGSLPTDSGSLLAYRFAFDPNDLDHVLFGAATYGAFVSTNAGKSWASSTGLSPSGKANAFEIAVSPAGSQIVWLEGIDLEENLANAQNEGRHIFRSNDAGVSFQRVVDHQPGVVTLSNGLPLVPHPTNPDIVYFEFGTYFSGYGTDLFKLDGTTLTMTHNSYNDILAIAFSPADPGLMYLGITQEQIN